jgi:anti-sigma factor RsiW
MPRFDPDTIAALAEGRLDPERAQELESAIVEDPTAADELAAHRTALSAIAAAAAPDLTTDERFSLRSAVAEAIGIEAPEPQPAARRPRRVPWAALSVAVVVLVALAAAAPLVNLLSTGEESATAPTLGAVAESTIADTAGGDVSLSGTQSPSATEAASATRDRDFYQSSLFGALDQLGDQSNAAKATGETACVAEAAGYLGPDDTLYTIAFEGPDGTPLVAFYTVAEDGSIAAAIAFDPTDCSIGATYP